MADRELTGDMRACVASFNVLLMVGSAVQVGRRRRNKRRCWVKPWIKLRPISGACSGLIEDLMNSDRIAFSKRAVKRM